MPGARSISALPASAPSSRSCFSTRTRSSRPTGSQRRSGRRRSRRRAAKAIQVYVSALRKALGSARHVLETRAPGYVLRVAPGELDLHVFEELLARARGEEPAPRAATLRAALALWRDAPLADFAYDPFVQTEAARLEELRQLALEERIEAELELGGGRELIGELQALVTERPLQERPRALLMRAFYRAGRQSDALDVFREGRRLLDEELGLEPGPGAARARARDLAPGSGALLEQRPTQEATGSIVAVPDGAGSVGLLLPLAEALARGPTGGSSWSPGSSRPPSSSATAAALDEVRRELTEAVGDVRVAAFSSSSPAEDVVRLGDSRTPTCFSSRSTATRSRAAGRGLRPSDVRRRRHSSSVAGHSEPGRLSFRSAPSSTTGLRSSSAPGRRRRSTARSASSGRPTRPSGDVTQAACSRMRP